MVAEHALTMSTRRALKCWWASVFLNWSFSLSHSFSCALRLIWTSLSLSRMLAAMRSWRSSYNTHTHTHTHTHTYNKITTKWTFLHGERNKTKECQQRPYKLSKIAHDIKLLSVYTLLSYPSQRFGKFIEPVLSLGGGFDSPIAAVVVEQPLDFLPLRLRRETAFSGQHLKKVILDLHQSQGGKSNHSYHKQYCVTVLPHKRTPHTNPRKQKPRMIHNLFVLNLSEQALRN